MKARKSASASHLSTGHDPYLSSPQSYNLYTILANIRALFLLFNHYGQQKEFQGIVIATLKEERTAL